MLHYCMGLGGMPYHEFAASHQLMLKQLAPAVHHIVLMRQQQSACRLAQQQTI